MEEFKFDTQAEVEAFCIGVETAYGYMEAMTFDTMDEAESVIDEGRTTV